MKATKTRLKAIVRAFDLILTFESDKSDHEIEKQTQDMIEEINEVFKKYFLTELPQLEFDDQKGKKKMKIGITPIITDPED